MKSKLDRNYFIKELNYYFLLGVKFGIVGALIGLVLHVIWGNLYEVSYTILTCFSIGFLIGVFEIFFSSRFILGLPYLLILLFRIITYLLLSLILVFSFLVLYLKNNDLTTLVFSNPKKFEELRKVYFLTNINMFYIVFISIAATFIWQLKTFFGKGIVLNYLIGRYHKPRIEERIFMFLDLNKATTIAESIGSKMYSNLLSDFFRDIDLAITKTKGTVFQYVGDEVVVIWKMKDGLKNNNCIETYILAERILGNKKKYYFDKYNIFPTFKASLHTGPVTITEIGVSKKEIVYHGDTINTASRICSVCNNVNKMFLVSAELISKLSNIDDHYKIESVGLSNLKGKKNTVGLLSIEEK
ncbi:MAG: adenylate/guanylate cyclase domain-containing protein [Ignavibacteriae bacterium]|nr:adenylate/guanylate cyclase domain-containing protein [Ignavibacteriota bacterium]